MTSGLTTRESEVDISRSRGGCVMNLRRFSTIPVIAVVTVAYFGAGKLGLALASLHASASPVWPPAGIAIAVLLVFGYRTWPAIFIGAFLVNLTTAGNFATSLGIASGNTLEALGAAWLVNQFANGADVFERAGNVFKFALAVGVSTLISPSVGVTSLALGGYAPWDNYGAIWMTWWLGDVTGALVLAPLVVLWCAGTSRQWTRGAIIEVTSLFVSLLFLAEIGFGGWFPISATNYPISFVYGPLLVWLAFRFTPRETATGIFILTAIGIWGTLHGRGPFVLGSENQSLLILQARTAILAITCMALAAGMAERRRAQAAVEQQRAAVETANRTKDNFLAMLSHELRTPLTPVLAALDALESIPAQSEDTKNAVSMIRRNVELESQLIDDLLDLTRIAKDKLQLTFETIDAHFAIRNVAEICRGEADARKLSVHLHLQAGAHFISADAAKFQQIVWNLLKNGIKFTNEGGSVTISTANPAPQVLEINISDTGIGLEPDIMDRMFNPFEQGDRSFQRRFGGLGLGLAISKSLTEAHSGTLAAKSEGRDRGSTFTVTLQTVAPPQRLAKFAPPPPGAGRSLRILLVDDHQDTCTALERLLIRRGHLVAAMPNMRSAMEVAARSQFDLLISDIALPDGSGIELMTCLRAISGIPGIAISGFGMNGDIEKSLQAGFAEHLVKPVKIEKLDAAIERVVAAEVLAN